MKLITREETLDKLNDLGVKYVELNGGQTIGAGIEGVTDFKMSPEKRNQLKDLLASKGITPVAFGVTSGSNEEEWNQLFEFAQDLGIEVITSEHNFGDLEMIESLLNNYNIIVAFHIHTIHMRY